VSRRRLSTERLVRHVLGELSGEEREETTRAIADSRSEAEREAQVRGMIEELGRPPAWTESVDLTADVRAAIDREGAAASAPVARSEAGRTARRRGRLPAAARGWLAGGGAAAAAAVVAIVLVGRERGVTDGARARGGSPGGEVAASEVRPKGPASPLADPDRWVGIRLALARAGGGAQPVTPGDRIGRGELQVSYTNLGPRPYARLMVFAVDAAGQVRWLYPAHEREDTDPGAIVIEPGAADRLLPDRIENDLAPGRVVVCGVFLREPLTVKQVERALGGGAPATGARLPLDGTGQHCFDLEAE
jgi:hypothetical protein